MKLYEVRYVDDSVTTRFRYFANNVVELRDKLIDDFEVINEIGNVIVWDDWAADLSNEHLYLYKIMFGKSDRVEHIVAKDDVSFFDCVNTFGFEDIVFIRCMGEVY